MERVTGRIGWLLAAVLGLFIVAALAGVVHGGPLDPPGPPASTDSVRLPGTPIASIPYTISQPGTYYLTHDLSLATSGDGITIAADDVTIDLTGFTIKGPGATFAGNGITDGGITHKNLLVRNGTLSYWPDRAILISATTPVHVEDLRIRKSTDGLMVGNDATARNIQVYDTTGVAIQMWHYSRIDGCSVNTAATGINSGQGVLVSNCSIAYTTNGMILGPGSHVTDCTINSATTAISAGAGSVIQGCSVLWTTNGIQLDLGAQAINCSVQHSLGAAISASAGAVVRGCSFYNTDSGVQATGALIEDNSIESVTGGGACAITFSGSGGRADDNKIRGVANGICSASAANTAYHNTFDGIGTAFFSGAITSAPMDYPPTWTNPWANIGY